MQDIELLGLFANQAAIAIRQSQRMAGLEAALVGGLRKLAFGDGGQPSGELLATLEDRQNGVSAGDGLADGLEQLADMINDFSAMGTAERRACLQILQGVFREYSRSKPELGSPLRGI